MYVSYNTIPNGAINQVIVALFYVGSVCPIYSEQG